MEDNAIGKEMVQRAVEFMDHRFPAGWGGCAIMHGNGCYVRSTEREFEHYAFHVSDKKFRKGAASYFDCVWDLFRAAFLLGQGC